MTQLLPSPSPELPIGLSTLPSSPTRCHDLDRAVPGDDNARTGLPAEDSRTYLMRRQRSISKNPKKLRRMRTELLPLETTPSGLETWNLEITLEITSQSLSNQLMDAEKLDEQLSKESTEDGDSVAVERRIVALFG